MQLMLEMSIVGDQIKFVQGNVSDTKSPVAMPTSVFTQSMLQKIQQTDHLAPLLQQYSIPPSLFASMYEAQNDTLALSNLFDANAQTFGIEPDMHCKSDMSYLRQTLPLPSVSFIADPSHSHHDADGKTDQILAKDLIKVFKRNFDSLEVGQQSCGSAASAASLAHLQQLSRSFCAHPASTARADMCSEMPRLPLLGNAEHDPQTAAGPVTSTAMPTAMSAHETEVLRRAHLLVWEVAAQVAAGGGAAAAAAVMAATLGRDGRLRFRPPAAQPSA